MFTNKSGCRRPDEGFTLLEVMIAMFLTALVMTAALPALIGMLKSSATVKLDTRAKNLTQERIEQMRDLRFHIDRQNGPFLDLLDIYYTNAKTAGTVTSLPLGGNVLTGRYVPSAVAANGEPAAPFYRVSAPELSGFGAFSQKIYTQFLAADGSAIPAASFQNRYDSQLVGKDQAPSLMVGITVITSWTDAGRAHTLRAYTRVGEDRAASPVIQTQGHAIAVDLTSTAADGKTVKLQAGLASADGTQASGSRAAGYATGGLATRTGDPTVSGLLAQFNFPTQGMSSSGSGLPQAGSGCGWFGFGDTGVSNATGDITNGLPKVPADADPLIPGKVLAGYITDSGGGGCGLLSYDNLPGGGVPRPSGDPIGDEMGAAPYARIADTVSTSAAAISGAAYVSSSSLTAVPQKSVAGATAFARRLVVLFPNSPESGGKGLVSVALNYASVDCVSGSASADGAVVGKYSVTLNWWGKAISDVAARWHTASWTYNSALSATPVLVPGSDLWDPATTLLRNGVRLNQLVTGTAPTVLNIGATSGLRGFTNGILSLSTASTLANEAGAGYSAIKLQVGQLTCVADDQR